MLKGNCCPDCCAGDACENRLWLEYASNQWVPIIQELADSSNDAELIYNQCKPGEKCGGDGCGWTISPASNRFGRCYTRKLVGILIEGYERRGMAVPGPYRDLYTQTEEAHKLPLELRRMGVLEMAWCRRGQPFACLDRVSLFWVPRLGICKRT